MRKTLLRIENLKVYFYTYKGVVRALDGVNLELENNEILGLVGETGCGKSVTALSILRLIDPPGKIVSGKIILEGENLLEKTEEEMSQIRGRKVSMIFQDPTTSLNPVFTIGNQMLQVIRCRQNVDKNEAHKKAVELLRSVYLPNPEEAMNRYPHELSGGMQQRIMIALALSCNPQLLIADEPTTSLDVTIQAQILNLIQEIQNKMKISVLWITHDFHVVAEICNKVAVMYAGRVVEFGDIFKIYANPAHPYTSLLFKTIPSIENNKAVLPTIKGTIPNLIHPPMGCRFHPRCPFIMKICKEDEPYDIEIEKGHFVSCHQYV